MWYLEPCLIISAFLCIKFRLYSESSVHLEIKKLREKINGEIVDVIILVFFSLHKLLTHPFISISLINIAISTNHLVPDRLLVNEHGIEEGLGLYYIQ